MKLCYTDNVIKVSVAPISGAGRKVDIMTLYTNNTFGLTLTDMTTAIRACKTGCAGCTKADIERLHKVASIGWDAKLSTAYVDSKYYHTARKLLKEMNKASV